MNHTILQGQTVKRVEVYENDDKTVDTLVLVMNNGQRFSIEAEGGYLTVGVETPL